MPLFRLLKEAQKARFSDHFGAIALLNAAPAKLPATVATVGGTVATVATVAPVGTAAGAR